jgi:hypothetical protein
MIERCDTTDQHLFRVAASQCASAAEGSKVDDSDLLAGGANPHGSGHGGSSGTDYYKVILFRHNISPGFIRAALAALFLTPVSPSTESVDFPS